MIDIDADLTVGCDGRHSLVREARRSRGRGNRRADGRAVVPRRQAGQTRAKACLPAIDPGKMMVTFDRGDYWQCAYVIAKGQHDAVKASGLARASATTSSRMAPILEIGIG